MHGPKEGRSCCNGIASYVTGIERHSTSRGATVPRDSSAGQAGGNETWVVGAHSPEGAALFHRFLSRMVLVRVGAPVCAFVHGDSHPQIRPLKGATRSAFKRTATSFLACLGVRSSPLQNLWSFARLLKKGAARGSPPPKRGAFAGVDPICGSHQNKVLEGASEGLVGERQRAGCCFTSRGGEDRGDGVAVSCPLGCRLQACSGGGEAASSWWRSCCSAYSCSWR
jgi:hypothetical protein